MPMAVPQAELDDMLIKVYKDYPIFHEPDYNKYQSITKDLLDRGKMPKSVAEFQQREVYFAFDPETRWIIGAYLQRTPPPEPKKKREVRR